MKSDKKYHFSVLLSFILNLITLNLFSFYSLHLFNKFNEDSADDYVSTWLNKLLLLLLLAVPVLNVYIMTLNIIQPNKYTLEILGLFIVLIILNSTLISLKQKSVNNKLIDNTKIHFNVPENNFTTSLESIVIAGNEEINPIIPNTNTLSQVSVNPVNPVATANPITPQNPNNPSTATQNPNSNLYPTDSINQQTPQTQLKPPDTSNSTEPLPGQVINPN